MVPRIILLCDNVVLVHEWLHVRIGVAAEQTFNVSCHRKSLLARARCSLAERDVRVDEEEVSMRENLDEGCRKSCQPGSQLEHRHYSGRRSHRLVSAMLIHCSSMASVSLSVTRREVLGERQGIRRKLGGGQMACRQTHKIWAAQVRRQFRECFSEVDMHSPDEADCA